MFIKDNINYKRRRDLEKNMSECLWIEIFTKHSKSFLIGCFYRHPGTSNFLVKNCDELFCSHMNTIMNEKNRSNILR